MMPIHTEVTRILNQLCSEEAFCIEIQQKINELETTYEKRRSQDLMTEVSDARFIG
jgi:hypothetical protein